MRDENQTRMSVVTVILCLLAAVACGGKEVGTGSATVKGAGGATNTMDSGAATDPAAACGRYFDSVVVPCAVVATGGPYWDAVSPLLPKSDFARARSRFLTYCEDRMGLPGTAFTPASVAACVATVDSLGCGVATGEACTFTGGTLPTGAACAFSEQCESGACTASMLGMKGPPGVAGVACGTCASTRAIGESCILVFDAGTPAGPMPPGALPPFSFRTLACGPNAFCDYLGTGTCLRGYRAEGQPCNPGWTPDPGTGTATRQCADGLTCDSASSTCRKPTLLGEGAPCFATGGPVCTSPLVCRSTTGAPPVPMPPPIPSGGTCQAPGPAGTSCYSDAECAEGLGCGRTRDCSSDPCSCAKLTFGAPGDVCGGPVQCLHGGCVARGERCPDVIPDGAACDPSGPPGGVPVCDTFATCIDGKCTLGVTVCN